jgi:integrase
MSYSDLAKFDYKKCVEVDGQVVYKSKRQKTKQEFTIVLLKPALTILKRYKNKLPIISNEKYNLYLKAAVKYAKIDKPVTTHWARHTGATLLINEDDVPMHIVQHILGHSTIRETEKTYAKVMDKKIVETMANIGKVAKVLPMKQKKVKVG